jgi:DUF4097 and DUF4098 domain-containing protein YvlB
MTRVISVATVFTVACGIGLLAQSPRDRQNDDRCGNSSRQVFCDVRDDTFISQGTLDADATPNGGIAIRGSDRGDVHVRTRIQARADDEATARALAGQVRVTFNGGRLRAEGPETSGDQWWSASFEIDVPRNSRLQLTTKNGGISIADFNGYGRFETTNGGVALTNVGGDLQGSTTNGGVSVRLSGPTWNGAGLDVETRNGGVSMTLPQSFNAQLDVSTVNGGVSVDSVDQSQPRSRDRHIVTTLGAGGAPLRLATVNGGVRVARAGN